MDSSIKNKSFVKCCKSSMQFVQDAHHVFVITEGTENRSCPSCRRASSRKTSRGK